MVETGELDTLWARQEAVRAKAYAIRRYLFEPLDQDEVVEAIVHPEKIQQMIFYENGTFRILDVILDTLPKLGKQEKTEGA